MINTMPGGMREEGTVLSIAVFVGLLVSCAMITWSLSTTLNQTILSGILIFVLVQLSLIAPIVAITSIVIFLAALGDIRRLLGFYVGPVQFDTLLLVGPVIACTLLMLPFFQGRLDNSRPLGKWISVLLLLMFLQILNPLQGGLSVGLGGAFFYVIPLAWFWVGQTYATPAFLNILLYRLLLPLAILAALYGAVQQLIGFPEFQEYWLAHQANLTLNVGNGGHARPFGSFISPQEYESYVAMGSVAAFAAARQYRWLIGVGILLLISCILTGGRGQVLGVLMGVGLMWGVASHKTSMAATAGRVVLIAAMCIGGLAYSLFIAQSSNLDARINPYIQRQAEGVLTPGQSTAGDHGMLFATGILSSFTVPIGHGLGFTTIAAGKLGNEGGSGTEVDLSDMFVALGPIGGVMYFYVIVLVAKSVLRYVRRTGATPEGLAVMGMLVCMVGQWLTGGMYSVVIVLWLSVGTIDRLNREADSSPIDA